MTKVMGNQKISGEITSQLLGLTEQHIHFFDKKLYTNSVGIHHLMIDDFNALVRGAADDEITLKIASGFRSFERQCLIWNNKYTGKTPIKSSTGDIVSIEQLSEAEIVDAILLYSALPGASRHHWGCDIDIYAENLLDGKPLQLEPWEYSSTGPMAKLSLWLKNNANKFGFYFPYDQYRGGVAAEPWHLSYIPLAKQYQSILTIELLEAILLKNNVAGKNSVIERLPIIFKQYINNVNTPN